MEPWKASDEVPPGYREASPRTAPRGLAMGARGLSRRKQSTSPNRKITCSPQYSATSPKVTPPFSFPDYSYDRSLQKKSSVSTWSPTVPSRRGRDGRDTNDSEDGDDLKASPKGFNIGRRRGRTAERALRYRTRARAPSPRISRSDSREERGTRREGGAATSPRRETGDEKLRVVCMAMRDSFATTSPRRNTGDGKLLNTAGLSPTPEGYRHSCNDSFGDARETSDTEDDSKQGFSFFLKGLALSVKNKQGRARNQNQSQTMS